VINPQAGSRRPAPASTRSNCPRAADLEIGGADVAFLKTVMRLIRICRPKLSGAGH